MSIQFESENTAIQKKFESALEGLQKNIRRLPGFDRPVLTEGGVYKGVWLEGGPHQGLLYGDIDPAIAEANHRIFFDHMDEEGFIPPVVTDDRGALSGHLQTVVSIAQTALETVERFGYRNLLADAYRACARYDEWLTRFRNSKGTDLVEIGCVWDTGHDNSPRHRGLPNYCPDYDTKRMPESGGAPLLAPDMSATKYAGRVALARMAALLGKEQECREWSERARTLREAIFRLTYSPEDAMFYDVDCEGNFVRVKNDALSRVCGAFVPEAGLFETLFTRHLMNPKEFWTPYPLATIAADDPVFAGDFPENSWGGAAQALGALRAPMWMEHYGKFSELRVLMEKWLEAMGNEADFRQQMSTFSGQFNSTGSYSPAMCVYTDFVSRLYGVKRNSRGLRWGCTPVPLAEESRYTLSSCGHQYELVQHRGASRLLLDGKLLYTVYGSAVILTGPDGNLEKAVPTGVGQIIVE